jgi:transcriptional regulator with XRE-family HTH domain
VSGDIDGRAFGLLIAKLRKEAGISQSVFAAAVGVSRQAIQKWEKAPYVNPRRQHLRRAARVLGVPVEQLYAALDTYDAGDEENRLLSWHVWRVYVDDYLASALGKGTARDVADELYRTQRPDFSRHLVHEIRKELEKRAGRRR